MWYTLLPYVCELCAATADQVVKPYEPPSRGLSHLPPLPPLYTSIQHNNNHSTKQLSLFATTATNTASSSSSNSGSSSASSSSKQKVRGPADCGTWVIPHLVLLGEIPVGTTKAQQWQCSKRSSRYTKV
jgi:hypothetical protein